MKRRDFIKSTAAGWLLIQTSGNALLARGLSKTRQPKIVWVMLRGAMDSLHGVLPLFDESLMQHRASLVKPLVGSALPIDRGFYLHPALKNCHELYKNEAFLPIVAVASGYRSRSHFKAQDQMESGLDNTDHESGWMARALNVSGGQGLAIAQTVPIGLRGTTGSQTWFPSKFPPSSKDLLGRLKSMYTQDEEFSQLLDDALINQEKMPMDIGGTKKSKPVFSFLAKRCGELLSIDGSANCAMLELGGWDTHNGQQARLNRQFDILDRGLDNLRVALGKVWQDTVVIVTTEFGRTVAVNGTKGTDHGTGAALFLAGGAVKGRQVLGDWPGLDSEALYEKRDLMPTSDVRSWMASVLEQHWGLSLEDIKQVFPNVKPMAQTIIRRS